MAEIFPVLSLFVLFFACILIMFTVGKKIFGVITVFEYERGLKYTEGKFIEVIKPGRYWLMLINTAIKKVDVRPALVTIPGQEVMTSEGVSIKLSLVANYQVVDPVAATHKTEDFMNALYLVVQVALREIVGTVTLDNLLENRNILGEKLREKALPKVKEIGLELYEVSIKDISLNNDLKKAYSQIIMAQKEGLARLEKARSEAAALRSLSNTAKMLDNNPSLVQLRILQSVGETSGNTIVVNMSGEGNTNQR